MLTSVYTERKIIKNLGMACQSVHKEGYKNEGEYTKPHPSLATSFQGTNVLAMKFWASH